MERPCAGPVLQDQRQTVRQVSDTQPRRLAGGSETLAKVPAALFRERIRGEQRR
jgi:hypothetical protein